jgi:bifunctional non-homologous end joining protein LigD
MRAVSGPLPDGDGWGYEIKWDGMRLRADVGPDRPLRLWSSQGNLVTHRFPELGALSSGVHATSATLDGELVAFDERGRPSFGRLQHRIHVDDPGAVAAAAAEVPVAFVVFDLLELDGTDITGLPLSERRRALEAILEPGPAWKLSQLHLRGGNELLSAVTDAELEGVVAKRLDSTYTPGRRSPSWIKTKIRRRQEFVVGGWSPGLGSGTGRLGALLVGYYDDGALRFAGRVGSGLTEHDLAQLQELLGPDVQAPSFDPPPDARSSTGAHWVEPRLVVEVAFAEWPADGHLRHPAVLGRHADRDPRSVRREPQPGPIDEQRSDTGGARD